jgi:hypothetical protein
MNLMTMYGGLLVLAGLAQATFAISKRLPRSFLANAMVWDALGALFIATGLLRAHPMKYAVLSLLFAWLLVAIGLQFRLRRRERSLSNSGN